jgi:hypothetical protein
MPLDGRKAAAPQPGPPRRAFSFTDWATNHPALPPPGDRLDSELSQSFQAIQAVIAWASASLGADGSLRQDAVLQALGVAGGKASPGNSPNDIALAEAIAQDYATLSAAWAEHMPDTIPPNILAAMDITGDHWSSRWWAHRAASLGVQTGHALTDDLLDSDVGGDLTLVGNLQLSGDLSLTGTVIAQGNIESAGNVTAEHAVIGHHLFAFERLGDFYGGVVGSWDPVSLKGAGFRLNASVTPPVMEFGPADPGLGVLTSVAMTLNGAGDLAVLRQLNVVGDASFASNLLLRSGLYVRSPAGGDNFIVDNGGNVSAVGDTGIAGNLVVGKDFTLTGGLNAGSVFVHGSAAIDHSLVVGDSLTTSGSVTVGQFLSVRNGMRLAGISPYADNAAAIAAGHVNGDVYFNQAVNALSVVVGGVNPP